MEGWASLEAPARKVYKRKPDGREPVTVAHPNMRSNPREVIGASAPRNCGLDQPFPFTNHAFDEGKRLKTNMLERHKDTKADDYSIRHVPTGYNSVASGRVITEHHRDYNTEGLVGMTETAGAVDHTMKPQWKSLDPHVPFDMDGHSAPVLYNFSRNKGVNNPNSVPLLSTNNGPDFHDPLNVADSKKSRTNPGYTKYSIPGVSQGFHGASNVEHGIKLPHRTLWGDQARASPMTSTSVSSEFLQ